ncbi:bifunctional DNA primase/polymerase [Streptomyces sp. NPDC087437]|uniref:bifunctional DNA primase/polymerase n=1 Tax=Streptomyces sp. NPDC087437 TaxID=3365789 RepID=UPI0037F13BDD
MKAAAVDYASTHGWRVFPVLHKKPLLSEWQHKASVDHKTILSWPQWDRATGLGLATGVGSRLLVLDVDGPKGEETIARYRREGRAFPETWEQRTGRDGGGRHLFFRTGDRLSKRSFRDLGLDIQAERAQVVAAPSLHPSGRRYESFPHDLAVAPEWLCEMAGEEASASVDGLGIPSHVEAALRAPQGKRNEALFRVYRWAIETGLSDLEIVDLVMSKPIASKLKGMADPTRWLLKDIERFRAQNVESIGFTVLEHIEWTHEYLGKISSSRRKAIRALQNLAVERGTKEITASYGDLAIYASMVKRTLGRSLEGLIAKDHLLSRVGEKKSGGALANRYQLRLPPEVVRQRSQDSQLCHPTSPTPTSVGGVAELRISDGTPGPGRVDPSHDAFRWGALGSSFGCFDHLTVPMTAKELAEVMQAKLPTVYRHIGKLVNQGVVEKTKGARYVRTADWADRLDQIAETYGTKGRKQREEQQLREDRENRRLARIKYARENGVKWEGRSPFDPLTGEILPDGEEPSRGVPEAPWSDQQTSNVVQLPRPRIALEAHHTTAQAA